jgi:hypothetical protein
MTAYRSTNTYRQDLLRYDGGTNVIVTPATIAATSTVPAVTVTEGAGVTVAAVTIAATTTVPAVQIFQSQTINLDAIAATATTPAVTVTEGTGVSFTVSTVDTTSTAPAVTITEGVGVTVNVSTVSTSGLIPESTVTEGVGVTVTSDLIVTVSTAPDVVVTGGTIQVTAAVSVDLETYAINPRVGAAVLDVQPYHVVSPNRRWKSHLGGFTRPTNIVILNDGTVTDREPVDRTLVSKVIGGGRNMPLTDEDISTLLNANYALEVK